MMDAGKKVITPEEWDRKLGDVKIRKEDMDFLVMDFLMKKGLTLAAWNFWNESGTDPGIDLATVTLIKEGIERGNIEDAIEKLNDLIPEFLNTKPELYFHLHQQRFIELIRSGKVLEALEVAQEELAPMAEVNPSFCVEVEKTASLLAFRDPSNCPSQDLMDGSRCLELARRVEATILRSRLFEKEPRLSTLIKTLFWTQNQLLQKALFPKVTYQTRASLLSGR